MGLRAKDWGLPALPYMQIHTNNLQALAHLRVTAYLLHVSLCLSMSMPDDILEGALERCTRQTVSLFCCGAPAVPAPWHALSALLYPANSYPSFQTPFRGHPSQEDFAWGWVRCSSVFQECPGVTAFLPAAPSDYEL